MKTTAHKPNYNSYHGQLTLVSESKTLKRPVKGWALTFSDMDMDMPTTLPAGSTVTVWQAEKTRVLFLTAAVQANGKSYPVECTIEPNK